MESNEIVMSFIHKGHQVDVIGCWDSETPENEFDFYDIFVEDECINLGDYYFKKPTKKEVIKFVDEYIKRQMYQKLYGAG
jgi:hypothetical protein